MQTKRRLFFQLVVLIALAAPVFAEWDCYPLEPVFEEIHTYWICVIGPCPSPACGAEQVGERVYCNGELISGWGTTTGDECIEAGQQCGCI